LFVERTQGDSLTAMLIGELKRAETIQGNDGAGEKEPEGEQQTEDTVLRAMTIETGLYERGYVRLLGASSLTPFASTGQAPSGVKVLGVFGADGNEIVVAGVRKKVKMTSFDSLQAISAIDPKGWTCSPWKLQ